MFMIGVQKPGGLMEILNVRIDERLIHAQVASVWTSTLNATRIMVIDDSADQDDVQQIALKMTCPSSIKLTIVSAERAVDKLMEPAYPNDRLFIVMKGPKVLKKMLSHGYAFKEVNVGNIACKEDGIQIKRSITLSREQIDIFKELAAKGIKFTSQLVPSEEKIDFMSLLEDK